MNRFTSIFSLIAIFMLSIAAYSQSKLHTPLEFQKAYQNGTRSMDGKPGVNYWQNFVDYSMEVEVTPETRAVAGSSTVVYTNNSPDELNAIVVRLYYDVFKKGNQRGMAVNSEDIGDGVDLKSITVNDQPYPLDQPQLVQRSGTNLILRLMGPLKTGESITMNFEWEQKVPLTVIRTGAIDPTSFFVAYWYPQVSVYDDVFGWDQINYTFETEFYNNLANFDVKITAPDNFLVWATGTFQNPDEVLPNDILTRYRQAKKSNSTVNIVTAEDLTELKMAATTWHYTAKEVSDFAFAMSDHYHWDAAIQEVDGRDVLISTAYPTNRADQFTEVTAVQQKAMKAFSEDVPGVPYPYEAFTSFIGLRGGGMEFPMMANNDGPGTGVTIHEMFHTYFPMYVRINERRFAWMDEGWADFVTALVMHKHFNNDNQSSFYASLGLGGTAGSIGDLPTVTSSQYMGNNYGYHSYSLPAFTYGLLYQHLGEEKFLEAFQTYIKRWAKKSPTPYDFFHTFEDVSGEDLSWLWNSWYFGFGYPDLAIESFEKDELTVRRLGERPVPVSIVVEYESKEGSKGMNNYSVTMSASVWQDGAETFKLKIPDSKKVKTITLNGDMPDVNELDNYFPSLQERLKEAEIPEDVFGTYAIDQYPINAIIEMDDGLLKMRLPEAGMEAYMMPRDADHLESINGNIVVTLSREAESIKGLQIEMKNFGVTVTAKKK